MCECDRARVRPREETIEITAELEADLVTITIRTGALGESRGGNTEVAGSR